MRLTAAQYEIWQQQQQLASTAVLNIGEYVEITGAVREEMLAAAIRSTVAEVEALRLRVIDTPDGPHQQPAALECPIHLADLRGEPNPRQAAERWMAEDMATDRCVYTDQLFAHAIFRLADDIVLWYHRVHHLVLDGYGLVLVSRRVAQTYTALAAGATPPPVNFGSLDAVADHDHAQLSSDEYTRAAQFWVDYERDRPEPVGPAGRTAPLSPHMTRVIADLPTALVSALRGLRTATSAEAIVAGIAAYLYRLTGSPQINLALPVMMRLGTPALRVPTMTVNAIHCWTDFSPATSFSDTISQVRDHLRVSRPHHRYRYGDLLRKLVSAKGDRRVSGPSVNVMPFDFGLRFADAPGIVRNVAAGVEEDIAFRLYDYGDPGLRLVIDGNPALYSRAELEAHARRLPRFLETLLSQPDRPIESMPLLDDADLALLRDWQNREIAAAEPAEETVVGMLWERVRAMPERTAVVDANSRISFGEFGRRVEALALHLRARGIEPGSVVLLVMPRTVDAVVALFAAAAAGAAYVAADPDHPAEHLEFLYDDSGAAVVVSAGEPARQLPIRLRSNRIGVTGHDSGSAETLPEVHGGLPLCLTYTSGTTGKPKGAVITHRAMANLGAHHRRGLIPDAASPRRAALTASLCFDTSWEALLWLLGGHELHVVSGEVRVRPELLLEYVARHRIDFLDVTPTMAEQLLAAGLLEPGAPRPAVLALGGEAVGQALWTALRDAPDIAAYNLYGPSEATVDATWTRLADSAEPLIGQAISGVRCAVLDARMRPVPPGTPGELYLSGESLALGYHRRAGMTAGRFVADPAGPPGARRYRTGDRVRRLLDGRLEYLGRTDDQVNLAGVRIEPAAIDAALSTHPGVVSAACAVIDDRLIGYVVTAADPVRPAELRRHLLDRVPRYLIPAAFLTLDRMPTTLTGKLDRAALPRPAVPGPSRAARDERERRLCALFAEVLGVASIGVDDDFFTLGGDSVTAARLAARIREDLETPVEVRTIFETATVAELAAELNAISPRPKPIPDLAAEARLDPGFVVPQRPLSGPVEMPSGARILLTGATGFLGAFLLESLLRQPGNHVTCLVRATGDEHRGIARDDVVATGRLQDALRRYGIEAPWDRVTVLAPVAVHRPARVCGHSRTGVGNDRDAFWIMVRAMTALGFAPDLTASALEHRMRANLVPVDHVADAVAHLVHSERTGVFHHVAPEPTPLATVLARLHALGYPLTPVPEAAWIDLLPRLGGDGEQCRALLAARPPAPPGSIRFDRTATDHALREANITPPHVDDDVLDACLRFYLRTGFLPHITR
ncbi:amino acid adenylation domain-containing protein [Nocardia yunnanensis]|uniref:Amino acid adenylation domain-containing protein n=1 Tax=Nocardia yunnanensis TaxID=2382165 RepID=A0A386Z8H6_9NOCA|nr:non-ribosomal peptide synthetase [Nocardia yunnanensis]AYF73951.1 amino acid adenylation domain-containing protein [Nocardia yunnanensis]